MKLLASLALAAILFCFASPAKAAQSEIALSSPVLIVGKYAPGGTIRAIYPSDPGITATIDWSAAGESVQSGNSDPLTITEALVGKAISAEITLHQQGLADKVVAASGEVVSSALPDTTGSMGWGDESVITPGCFSPRPSNSGGPKVGWPVWFSCQPYNTNFGAPTLQTFAWYRNGQLIEGETSSQYRLKTEDSGHNLWGSYKAVWGNGYTFTESKMLPVAIPYEISVNKPTIRGQFRFKGKLFAMTPGWDSAANLTFQWFRNYAPIAGATSRSYRLQRIDLDKNIQVMVSAERSGFSSVSRVSDPAADADVAVLDASAAYKKVFSSYQPTTNVYDISYITSPTMTQDALAHEQSLVKRAADFWSPQFTPEGVTIVYLTKDDTLWAESLIQQHPGWASGIPGGIRSWIEGRNCGFALAFMAEQKQVFIQCVHLGSDHSLNDDQVSIHEYSHWFQYQQNPALYSSTSPWLVEGQANFYGLALGVGPADPDLRFINYSLAGHATQWDLYNGYGWGTFKFLDLLEAGDTYDTQIFLSRSGLVWDSYYLGSLASEWLISNYGHAKYVAWTQNLLRNKGQTRDTEITANAIAFRDAFGFDFSELAFRLTPYIAARSAQVRSVWNIQNDKQVRTPVLGSTQKLPAFAAAVTTLNDVQRDWILERLKDQTVSTATCNVRGRDLGKANESIIFKARAERTCDFIRSLRNAQGIPYKTSATVATTRNSSEWGNVFVTFGR